MGCQLVKHGGPTGVFGAHVDLVEVALETAVVHAVHLHNVAGHPLAQLEHREFFAQAALAVAVHDVGKGGGGEDFVDGVAVQLFSGFGTGVEVGDAKAHAVGVPFFDVFAALDDGSAGADHVVEHDYILACYFVDSDVGKFRVEGHGNFTFAGTDLVHDHALAFGELQGIIDGVHEGAGSLVGGDNHQVVAIFTGLYKVAALDVVGVHIGRNQVVEVAFENVVEEVLDLDAVVVARYNGVDTSLL